MDANTRQRMISRLLRLGVSSSSRSSSDDLGGQGELETELALLREENAWLKVERHRRPDTGRVVESMRELAQAPAVQTAETEASPATDPARTLVECLAIRDGLLEACKEVQEAMQGIRSRLSGLAVDVNARAGNRAARGPISTPSSEDVDLELARGTRANSDLSKNAA
jgi:hypothetical protein